MIGSGDLRDEAASPIIAEVVEQHAEEAAFLWTLRDTATEQPHFTGRHLADLDERIEAHLDGLREAGPAGFEMAQAQLDQHGGPGALFAVATLALERRDDLGFARSVEAGLDPSVRRGLFGAIGWVSPEALRGRAMTWIGAQSASHRLMGLVACSLHRADPAPRLEGLLDDEPSVRSRAFRLAGELGRVDLRDRIRGGMTAEDPACRFWAAWSSGLLTEGAAAIPVLAAFATGDGPFKWPALDLVLRIMEREMAKSWLAGLARDSAHARLLVVAAGILGDPAVGPWLLEKMGDPPLARVAGESFAMITGCDLTEDGLEGDCPAGFAAVPTDDADDENVGIDPDENLPWPDAGAIEAWWRRERPRFALGVPHLAGTPVTATGCEAVVQHAYQRQRRAAAHALALMRPGTVLGNWRARSPRPSRRPDTRR